MTGDHRQVTLADDLAGALPHRQWIRLARIGVELGPGERARALRPRHVRDAGRDDERGSVVAGREEQAHRPSRRTLIRVIAVAVPVYVRDGRRDPHDADGARNSGGRNGWRGATSHDSRIGSEQHGRRGGAYVDHAAGGIAIERRRAAAHHLDTIGTFEVEHVHRGLPVGKRDGHAILKHADAAHTEGRARTVAADAHARILRGVLPVGERHTRHGEQQLVHTGLAERGERIGPCKRHGPGQLERSARPLARSRHAHGWQRRARGVLRPRKDGRERHERHTGAAREGQ